MSVEDLEARRIAEYVAVAKETERIGELNQTPTDSRFNTEKVTIQ